MSYHIRNQPSDSLFMVLDGHSNVVARDLSIDAARVLVEDDFPSHFTPEMRVVAAKTLAELNAMSLDHHKYWMAFLSQRYGPNQAALPEDTSQQ